MSGQLTIHSMISIQTQCNDLIEKLEETPKKDLRLSYDPILKIEKLIQSVFELLNSNDITPAKQLQAQIKKYQLDSELEFLQTLISKANFTTKI